MAYHFGIRNMDSIVISLYILALNWMFEFVEISQWLYAIERKMYDISRTDFPSHW